MQICRYSYTSWRRARTIYPVPLRRRINSRLASRLYTMKGSCHSRFVIDLMIILLIRFVDSMRYYCSSASAKRSTRATRVCRKRISPIWCCVNGRDSSMQRVNHVSLARRKRSTAPLPAAPATKMELSRLCYSYSILNKIYA